MSLDRRCFPVAAAWSPSGLEDGRHFRPGGRTLLPAWRNNCYFLPGGRAPLPAWKTDGSLTTRRNAIPSEGGAHWKLLRESGVSHHLRKPGCSEEGPSGERPRGSPASPGVSTFSRVRDKRHGWCLVSPAAFPGRGDLALPEACTLCSGRHVFTSLCSQQPLQGTCDSLPDLKIYLITQKKKKKGFLLQYFGLSVRNNFPHLHVAASLML